MQRAKKSNETCEALVGPQVISKVMGVSRNSVLNWARRGEIPAVIVGKTYRFQRLAVAERLGVPVDLFY